MYYKIVTCPCYADLLKEKEKEIMSCKNNLNCDCNKIHEVYVWKCTSHPLVLTLINPYKTCFCNECLQYEICSVCVEKRYNLNYRCPKFCLTYLPEYIKKGAMKIEYFLDQKMQSAPFFILETAWLILA